MPFEIALSGNTWTIWRIECCISRSYFLTNPGVSDIFIIRQLALAEVEC